MSLSAFKNPATYHLLSYGTLLGSTLFQSFVSGVVAFRVLPRPQFSTLQKHTFPVYFTIQSVLPVAMLLTYPRGASSLLPYYLLSTPTSLTTSATDTTASWMIGTMFITALVNLVYVGPKTTEVMGLRKHQETRDGKKSYDAGAHSKEMQALNKQFGVLHSVSTIINLVGLGAMIWYGATIKPGHIHATVDDEVQYRQLISRAVTQRLHSPSLCKLDPKDLQTGTLETWELQERLLAKDKARLETAKLCVLWEKFVQDVERAIQAVHILTPTRYEAPSRNANGNGKAAEANRSLTFAHSEEVTGTAAGEIDWEMRQRALVDVLSIFGNARMAG